MLPSRRLAAVTLTLSALAAGCATTMSVSSHVERGVNFAGYRTFDWGPADALPTGDPRLDRDPFFQDHVQGAIEKELAARGFARATAGARPDLLIHYHANITQRIDVDRLDTARGYCYDDGCRAGVLEYEAGTLVVDLVDAGTNRVIWRGWAQDSLEGVLGNPDRMSRQINDGVTRMFARLPRGL